LVSNRTFVVLLLNDAVRGGWLKIQFQYFAIFDDYLNQYKIPFAVTYSQVFSETAWPIITCDIPVDSA